LPTGWRGRRTGGGSPWCAGWHLSGALCLFLHYFGAFIFRSAPQDPCGTM